MVHATLRALSRVGPACAAAALVLFGGFALGGCASTARTQAVDPVGAVPGDLWIEVVVTPGRGVVDRARVEERPARFVLLPDGSMHGETDVLPEERVRPARVRRLAREQLSEVWSMLRSAGFTNAGFADVDGNVRLLEPQAGEVLATLEIHADGERFAFARRYMPGSDDQAAMRRVVRSIASLGWASDEALAESAELPLRYDLGADPYARFAQPARVGGEPSR
jgi:hypothetical protein